VIADQRRLQKKKRISIILTLGLLVAPEDAYYEPINAALARERKRIRRIPQ